MKCAEEVQEGMSQVHVLLEGGLMLEKGKGLGEERGSNVLWACGTAFASTHSWHVRLYFSLCLIV